MKLCPLSIMLVAFLASFVVGGAPSPCLIDNYYEESCYGAEEVVRSITWNRTSTNPALPAKLLRMHFHDCFVRGCDGSILLNSTQNNIAEKDAIPNLSVAGYEVIDEIKEKLESKCPGIVSCADILALAARDAVSFQFNESMWEVQTGRKDGNISRAAEVLLNLPSPFFNYSTLQQSFASKGLSVRDLVALSGGHTIGVGHCNLFSNRLYNFTGKGDQDPTLDSQYASFLKTKCPSPAATSVVDMDPGSAQNFDPHYFDTVKQNKGLFQSDAALLTDPLASALVTQLADPFMFIFEFGRSMERMGAIGILTGDAGEIRHDCKYVNS